MEHNDLPRIENVNDYRACADQAFVQRKQAYLVAKLNTLKLKLENRLADRSVAKESIYAWPGSRARSLTYQIQTIEALLEPPQWDLKLKYLRREILGLPFEIRQSLLLEFDSSRFQTLDPNNHSDTLPPKVRIQMRTTPAGRAKIDQLVEQRGATITAVIIAALESQLQNNELPKLGPTKSALSEQLAVWLPYHLHRDLQLFARRHRVTASEAARLMVGEYLRKSPRDSVSAVNPAVKPKTVKKMEGFRVKI